MLYRIPYSKICYFPRLVCYRYLHLKLIYLQVIDHYENPRNVGSLDKKDKSVGTGLVGAPACGDVMKLQIKVDENGKIIDAKFKTFGCGSAIASSSLATEWVKGKTVDEALSLKNTDIAKELSLPPVKLHCSSKYIHLIEDCSERGLKILTLPLTNNTILCIFVKRTLKLLKIEYYPLNKNLQIPLYFVSTSLQNQGKNKQINNIYLSYNIHILYAVIKFVINNATKYNDHITITSYNKQGQVIQQTACIVTGL